MSNAMVDFDDAVLGRGLAPEIESLIAEAGRLRAKPDLAESLLIEARRRAPSHPATLIALYRFYFYGHRLQQAREIAVQALEVARAALGPEFGAPTAPNGTPSPPLSPPTPPLAGGGGSGGAERCSAKPRLRPLEGEGESTQARPRFDARFDAAVRFYLFTLKGYAYLSMRLGEIETGRNMIEELRRLDPEDRVGGSVLEQVLARFERGDDGDDLPAAPPAPRGWAQASAR
jgi:hypothetical protein